MRVVLDERHIRTKAVSLRARVHLSEDERRDGVPFDASSICLTQRLLCYRLHLRGVRLSLRRNGNPNYGARMSSVRRRTAHKPHGGH